ncbi:MAG TPA: Dabb family protein [Luteitalea sp.]|nr:Dabb family protein [Luteitalea sp.]
MTRPSLVKVWLSVVLLAALVATPFVARSQAQAAKTQTVRHVVVFKYKPEATPAQIQQITDAIRKLATSIPGILALEDGVNNSPENKNQGFTHVFLLTFKDAAARDAYLPHPEHVKFGQLLRGSGIFVDAFVVDYVPTSTKP